MTPSGISSGKPPHPSATPKTEVSFRAVPKRGEGAGIESSRLISVTVCAGGHTYLSKQESDSSELLLTETQRQKPGGCCRCAALEMSQVRVFEYRPPPPLTLVPPKTISRSGDSLDTPGHLAGRHAAESHWGPQPTWRGVWPGPRAQGGIEARERRQCVIEDPDPRCRRSDLSPGHTISSQDGCARYKYQEGRARLNLPSRPNQTPYPFVSLTSRGTSF
jgi:hypothetical protein